MRRFALILLVVLLALPAGGEENTPRALVTRFMEALKNRQYEVALDAVGVEIGRETLGPVAEAISRQRFVIWRLKEYAIKDVRQDGGLALVTVEELHFKDLDANLRGRIARMARPLADAVRWGDNRVTETFVLVRLDGRWQFDTTHSGVDLGQFPLKEIIASAQRNERPSDELQQRVARFINKVGVGQVVQSLGSGGPILPMLAALAIPSFARARTAGTLTACKSNLKNLGTALEMYGTDYSGRYPTSLSRITPNYLKSIPTCPAASAETYSASYASASNPDSYTLCCRGSHHQGLPANFPQYNSNQGLIDQP